MKNIFKIYTRDLKSIVTHWGALVVALAIIVVPCLYGWINLIADWDPYGKTSDIQIAIVNNDEGYTLYDANYNMGNEICGRLIKEAKYGWNMVSEDKANEGVEDGTYYAKIIIPKNFSSELFGDEEVEDKVNLKYVLNQKMNPIASKMADSGASNIKDEMNGDIIQSVDEAIFEQLNSLGIKGKEYKPDVVKLLELINDVNKDMPKLENAIDNLKNGTTSTQEVIKQLNDMMPKISRVLYEGEDIINNTANCVNTLKVNGNQITSVLSKDINLLASSLKDADNAISQIDIDKINSGISSGQTAITDTAISTLTEGKKAINNGLSVVNGINDILKYINNIIPNQNITNMIDNLNNLTTNLSNLSTNIDEMINSINNKQQIQIGSIDNIKSIIKGTSDMVSQLQHNFNNVLVPAVNEISNKINTNSSNKIELSHAIDSMVPDISNFLGRLDTALELGNTEFVKLKDYLPTIKEKLETVVNKAKSITDNYNIDEIISILENNYEKTGDFFRTPVTIDKEAIDPVPDFGSQLSPFFSTLALWIAGYLLVMVLSTKAKEFEDGTKFTPGEEYFGKLLTFTTLGLLQSILLIAGNLLMLGVYVEHPLLLFVLSMFTSIVFTTVLYTLVAVFGNIGKILGIILLVLQLCAAGGTFPVEVMSTFFQAINPFLPFKYSIGIMRELAGTIAPVTLYGDIIRLLVFFLGSLLVGLLLKGVVNKHTKKYKEEWENSGFVD